MAGDMIELEEPIDRVSSITIGAVVLLVLDRRLALGPSADAAKVFPALMARLRLSSAPARGDDVGEGRTG
jgi:hypothetical protein